MAWLRGHLFYIDTYRENFKNLIVWNKKAQAFDIWHVASSSRPLLRLLKL